MNRRGFLTSLLASVAGALATPFMPRARRLGIVPKITIHGQDALTGELVRADYPIAVNAYRSGSDCGKKTLTLTLKGVPFSPGWWMRDPEMRLDGMKCSDALEMLHRMGGPRVEL